MDRRQAIAGLVGGTVVACRPSLGEAASRASGEKSQAIVATLKRWEEAASTPIVVCLPANTIQRLERIAKELASVSGWESVWWGQDLDLAVGPEGHLLFRRLVAQAHVCAVREEFAALWDTLSAEERENLLGGRPVSLAEARLASSPWRQRLEQLREACGLSTATTLSCVASSDLGLWLSWRRKNRTLALRVLVPVLECARGTLPRAPREREPRKASEGTAPGPLPENPRLVLSEWEGLLRQLPSEWKHDPRPNPGGLWSLSDWCRAFGTSHGLQLVADRRLSSLQLYYSRALEQRPRALLRDVLLTAGLTVRRVGDLWFLSEETSTVDTLTVGNPDVVSAWSQRSRALIDTDQLTQMSIPFTPEEWCTSRSYNWQDLSDTQREWVWYCLGQWAPLSGRLPSLRQEEAWSDGKLRLLMGIHLDLLALPEPSQARPTWLTSLPALDLFPQFVVGRDFRGGVSPLMPGPPQGLHRALAAAAAKAPNMIVRALAAEDGGQLIAGLAATTEAQLRHARPVISWHLRHAPAHEVRSAAARCGWELGLPVPANLLAAIRRVAGVDWMDFGSDAWGMFWPPEWDGVSLAPLAGLEATETATVLSAIWQQVVQQAVEPTAVETLERLAAGHSNALVRVVCETAACLADPRRSLAPLLESLAGRDTRVKRAAAWGLASLTSAPGFGETGRQAEVLAAALRAVSDRDDLTRCWVAILLGRLRLVTCGALLVALSTEPMPVGVAAAAALYRLEREVRGVTFGGQGDLLTAEAFLLEARALQLLRSLAHNALDAEHLLLAAASDPTCRAFLALQQAGLDPEELSRTTAERCRDTAYQAQQNAHRPNTRTDRLMNSFLKARERLQQPGNWPLLSSELYLLEIANTLASEPSWQDYFSAEVLQRLAVAVTRLGTERLVSLDDPRVKALQTVIERYQRTESREEAAGERETLQ